MPRDFIVVPESLEADAKGQATDRPSFAFRQVLDAVPRLAEPGDRVYLAPANSFGGPTTEERAAWAYLRGKGEHPFELFCPGLNLGGYRPDRAYVDTWENAVRLARVLDVRGREFELVVARLHARRALWCFRQAGYAIARVHAVDFRVEPGARVMLRNFYYRHPRIQRAYEWAAFWRDRWKYRHRAAVT